MELIVETYGKLLLGAAVVLLFVTLLFTGLQDGEGNVGVLRMLGTFFTEETAQTGDDFAVCVEESKRKRPEIFYRKDQALSVGSYTISELFGAVDCENAELELQMEEIYDWQGMEETGIYDVQTKQLHFTRPGVYIVQVCTKDRWNQMERCRFQIPVNGGAA